MAKNHFSIPCAAYLLLVQDGKILLSRRYNTGYRDGMYGLVSGHLEENETPHDCMIREAGEEAGIVLRPENLTVVHIMHRRDKESGGQRVDYFLTATAWEGEPRNMEPHKCDDLSWFPLQQLPENTLDFIREVIRLWPNSIFYSDFGF